jgi:hypothetical protein
MAATMPNKRPFYVDRFGIEFLYDHCATMYVWPWRRTGANRKWLSYAFEATFASLAAIQQEWRGFAAANGATPTEARRIARPPSIAWRLIDWLLP